MKLESEKSRILKLHHEKKTVNKCSDLIAKQKVAIELKKAGSYDKKWSNFKKIEEKDKANANIKKQKLQDLEFLLKQNFKGLLTKSEDVNRPFPS